jgi:hypothetical protein
MFGFHPVNLAFRFVLEMAALVAIGVGSYSLGSGPLGWVLAVVAPLVAAVVWGVFNVPGDESRSGDAPVAVSGRIRLLIEIAVFASGVAFLAAAWPVGAAILGVAVTLHYSLSRDRIRWLLAH